jgi:hypothetical protein
MWHILDIYHILLMIRRSLKHPSLAVAAHCCLSAALTPATVHCRCLRLVFNQQNYAFIILYTIFHRLLLSRRSLQHPSIAVANFHRRRSSPLLAAQARSVGSPLALAKAPILLLSFLSPAPFCLSPRPAQAFLSSTCTSAGTTRGAPPASPL